MDIFGEDGSPTIQSLARKMTLRSKGSSTSMNITALQRTSCAVERKADLNVIINTNFVVPGGRPLVHVVNECPRDYYVAYLTRRGWPLLDTFNWNIIIFLEAGERMKEVMNGRIPGIKTPFNCRTDPEVVRGDGERHN